MSLKQKLLDALKEKGRIDLNEFESICKSYPAKISAGEKRMREFREPLHPNYNPNVDIEKKDGYISAYLWKGREVNCCYSFSKFKVHDSNCIKKTIIKSTLF